MTAALGRGGDPRLLLDELLYTIREAQAAHPRSQQERIGLSEVGHPCDRWMSHKLARTPRVNIRSSSWLATLGVAAHTWLEDAFSLANVRLVKAGLEPRWLLEEKVIAGTIGGENIDGSTDVYDTATASVVDWKLVGKTRLDHYRRHGPGPQYRVQVHANGLGWVRKGYDVDNVAVCFLPRNAELDQTVWWPEPYDEKVAVAALARAEVIGMTNVALGPAAPAAMATVDHNCGYCEWFAIDAQDLTRACPGDPSRPKRTDSIVSLIA